MLYIVDYVLIDPATSSPDQIDPVHAEIINLLEPDIYATDGDDIRFTDIMDKEKLHIIPRTNEQVSTTSIIDQIKIS